MTGRRWLAASVSLAILGPGCGVSPETSPQSLVVDVRLDGDGLPLTPTTTATTSEVTQPGQTLPVTIYLVGENDRLVPTTRTMNEAGSGPSRIAAILGELLRGPDLTESLSGLRSAIPPTTRVLDVQLETGTAIVDLSADLATIGGVAELLAVGQLVVTVTTFPGVQRVVLAIDGAPVAIPLPGGALSEDPVELSQYSVLLTPPITDPVPSPTTGTSAPPTDEEP